MIKRIISVVLLAASLASSADTFTSGQVLTAAALNSALARKVPLADLSATGSGQGASLVGYKRVGVGTVARLVADKFADSVNAKDWGVKCDNTTNDTTAINATLADSVGKLIQFPQGTCLYDGGGTLYEGTVINGAGRYSTIFKATQPAAERLFYVQGYGAGLRQVGFKAAVQQTGGVYVALGGPETFIDDFFMDGDFTGVLLSGNVARIRHGRFQNGAPGAIRIRAEGGDNSQVIDDVLMGAQSPEVSLAGIRVRNNVALTISNTSVIQQGIGLLIDPYTSTAGAIDAGNVLSLTVTDTLLDHNSTAALKIAPSGTASVARVKLNNLWAASAVGDGVQLLNFGSGILSDIDFIQSQIVLNTGSGISTSGAVTNLGVVGGEISQNAFGIYQNAAVTGFRVVGTVVGAGSLDGNTNAAIHLASGSDKIVIIGNNLTGNGAAIDDGASSATYKVIQQNIGADSTPVAIASGAINGTTVGATTPSTGTFTSLTGSSILSSSATGGVGYKTGAGGTVTQATSKTTGVALNTVTGRVTMNAAALAAAATACFTMTNSAIAATDVVNVVIASGATSGAYTLQVEAVAAGSTRMCLNNRSAGSLSEAVVLNYAVLKGSAN